MRPTRRPSTPWRSFLSVAVFAASERWNWPGASERFTALPSSNRRDEPWPPPWRRRRELGGPGVPRNDPRRRPSRSLPDRPADKARSAALSLTAGQLLPYAAAPHQSLFYLHHVPHRPVQREGVIMRIIDRYLLRQFVQVFLICFISVDGLYVVSDALTNLDEFLRYAETEGTVYGLIAEFYSYRSIFMFERMSSMLTMITGMFTVTWIQRHNEMTALTAAGVSRARVIRPIVVVAGPLRPARAAGRECVIPRLAKKLDRDPKN